MRSGYFYMQENVTKKLQELEAAAAPLSDRKVMDS